MVTIQVIVEGGAPNSNENSETASNTESLRQSLNAFFTKLLARDDIGIIVRMGYGYRAAVKQFLQGPSDAVLFVDLDAPKSKMEDWFVKLKTEPPDSALVFSAEQKEQVFFMIQEMEAWFLKQPACFERWAKKENYTRRAVNEISEHSLLKGKNIEDISKPSAVTKDLMKHFFEKQIIGKKGKLAKYGKLRTAPFLLDCLDVDLLEKQDNELHRFKKFFDESRFLM